MMKILKWIGILFVGLIALGMVIEANKTPEQKAAEASAREQQLAQQAEEKKEQAKQEMAALPSFTASDLAKAYNDNTVAADQKFKGKKFKVSGTVVSINTDLMGDPYITLRGGVNQFMEPQFSFDESISQIASLKKGSKVTLICVGNGDVAKTPMSGSCILI